MTYQLAIDMGNSYTVVYRQGSGVVIKEPTILAVQAKGRSKEIIAVGNKAKELYGKTSSQIEMISPIQNGKIANLFYAKMFLTEILENAIKNNVIAKKNNIIFILPCGLSAKEQSEYRNLGYHLGINNVEIIYSSVCALTSLGVDFDDEGIHMVCNIGGGNTDLAILYGMNMINGCTAPLGGKDVDEKISKLLLRTYNLVISDQQAEHIKINIGSLLQNDMRSFSVDGIDAKTRVYRKEVVFTADIMPILQTFFDQVVAVIQNLLSFSSTETLAEIHKRGIYLCGGMTKIIGLERYLREKLSLPIFIDIHPEQTVILGAGTLLSHQKTLMQLL